MTTITSRTSWAFLVLVALVLAALVGVVLAAPAALADTPPAPLQCKQVNIFNYCRYPDGHVECCFAGDCKPLIVALAPGFWD